MAPSLYLYSAVFCLALDFPPAASAQLAPALRSNCTPPHRLLFPGLDSLERESDGLATSSLLGGSWLSAEGVTWVWSMHVVLASLM